jgi:hypothetical protein
MEEIAMDNKRKSRRADKPCQVNWVPKPDPAAESEFWLLYLKLALEVMVEAGGGDQEKPK